MASRSQTEPGAARTATRPTRTDGPTPARSIDDLLPRWAAVEPDEEGVIANDTHQRYPAPVGFLGALDHSLRVAAAEATGRGAPRSYRYTFVHGDDVYHLDLEDHDIDDGRAGRYRHAGGLDAHAALHRLSFRILDEAGSSTQRFRLWTALPADAGATPVLPVAVELRARSFLELEIVRVAG